MVRTTKLMSSMAMPMAPGMDHAQHRAKMMQDMTTMMQRMVEMHQMMMGGDSMAMGGMDMTAGMPMMPMTGTMPMMPMTGTMPMMGGMDMPMGEGHTTNQTMRITWTMPVSHAKSGMMESMSPEMMQHMKVGRASRR